MYRWLSCPCARCWVSYPWERRCSNQSFCFFSHYLPAWILSFSSFSRETSPSFSSGLIPKHGQSCAGTAPWTLWFPWGQRRAPAPTRLLWPSPTFSTAGCPLVIPNEIPSGFLNPPLLLRFYSSLVRYPLPEIERGGQNKGAWTTAQRAWIQMWLWTLVLYIALPQPQLLHEPPHEDTQWLSWKQSHQDLSTETVECENITSEVHQKVAFTLKTLKGSNKPDSDKRELSNGVKRIN